MKKNKLVTVLMISLFIYSCTSDNDDDDPTMDPPNNVTYTKNVKSIIDGKCLNCHSSPPTNNAPMPLVTFQNVRDAVMNRSLISQVESGIMPPTGTVLTSSQVQTIKDWRTGGYKE